MRQAGWAVVLPVKRLADAKTRLRGALAVPHERLVLAMARDTVRAVRTCPDVAEVLVVTDDPVASAALRQLGARVLPDAPAAGLNAAVAYGEAVAYGGAVAYGAAAVARPDRGVAALATDLPALRPPELAAALRAAADGSRRRFVPDAAGTGTTLLAAPPGVPLEPGFGVGSAARHTAAGARALPGDWPSLRRDVDTAADLAEAQRLGLGPHTAAVLRPVPQGGS